jgi:PhzF family phenazine biosynthesis protein
MNLDFHWINAFTDRPFAGNPAGVVPLETWLPDALMQRIAAECGLSETAFFVPSGPGCFDLRWFTPVAEIDLCGHATLATAHVIRQTLGVQGELAFDTLSGRLTVRDAGERLALDLPSRPPQPREPSAALLRGLGRKPIELGAARDLICLLGSEAELRALEPDLGALAEVEEIGVIVTAPGDDCDFVSRFFAPRLGVPEDPVTGSAHCTLVPFWAAKLGRDRLHARQVSARGGELWCELRGDRVGVAGHAVAFLQGTIQV